MSHIWGEDEAADRARCLAEDIHYCEPGSPYPGDKAWTYHPHARELPDSQEAGRPSGDTVRHRCPVCEMTWRTELPQ